MSSLNQVNHWLVHSQDSTGFKMSLNQVNHWLVHSQDTLLASRCRLSIRSLNQVNHWLVHSQDTGLQDVVSQSGKSLVSSLSRYCTGFKMSCLKILYWLQDVKSLNQVNHWSQDTLLAQDHWLVRSQDTLQDVQVNGSQDTLLASRCRLSIR